MIVFALGKSGHNWQDVLYRMPAGLVNQLMACYWMEKGVEIEPINKADINLDVENILKKIKVRKIKFDF